MLITMLKEIVSKQNRAVQTSQPQDSVYDAVHKMHEHNIGALLVVEDSQLIGIFTERDVLFRVVHAGLNPITTKVSEVMTPEPMSATLSTTIVQAMQIMTQKRIRHLPLVENDRLVGLVSSGDLTRAISSNREDQFDSLIGYAKVMNYL